MKKNQCYASGDFKKYFTENMKQLGLPVPSTLFDTYQTAIATATTMAGTLATLGKGATVAELIGATIALEKLAIAASISAAAYTGAVIGSIAVASGRSIGCGSRISDLFVFMRQNNLEFKDASEFYAKNPQILDSKNLSRVSYGARANVSALSTGYA
ncbi:hypothetical protein B0W48_05190 [Pseudoalteromonas aliena]|uniref:Uncharacterized protein n=1 Tax=Pseudoalteromonas aliena TaxID=247523 RepID=A0A1Q2GW83_9GAMM|nr:hypothetical protein [Pseudoalteromonas aliena]AQP99250.1 hypothetical protein B0W48_05190 [Pseudoalteromonas aliena]